jgi:hypothetical protein
VTSELIMAAIQCVQALRLNNRGAIYRVYQNDADQKEAKRALCFLNCMEKPYCLRYRIFSVRPLLLYPYVELSDILIDTG